jgi:hypothetical protein
MSGVEDGGPHRLVTELAATPGAVPALVALWDGGGRANAEGSGTDEAVRWLIAVGLARPASVGDSPAVYELTDVGRTLTRTLVDLARALAEPTVDE